MFKPFLSTPEHRKVTLYFGVICIHIYFWNAVKYLKEQYLTAPPHRLGAEREEQVNIRNGSLWQKQLYAVKFLNVYYELIN